MTDSLDEKLKPDSTKLNEVVDDAGEEEDKLSGTINLKSSDNQTTKEYEILAFIGEGGMGNVYKAKDCQSGETVALKALKKELIKDKTSLKRFNLEAEAAQSLDHPNLNSVIDHGTTEDGSLLIVMDYVDGASLRKVLEESGPIDTEEALDLFLELTEGLSYAHQNGVVHRDIKPANIAVVKVEGALQEAKVLDFGIAKVDSRTARETQDITETSEVFGSPQYMSPEQCLGFKLDERSDIYSLGCLIYETLCGHSPYKGENPIQYIVGHINENPKRFSQKLRLDGKAKKLESVVFRCLAKKPDDRYQSMEELHKDLELIKNNQDIPEYDTKRSFKASFSYNALIYSIAAICLLFLSLSIFPTDTISDNVWSSAIGGISAFLCTVGSIICFKISNNKLKFLNSHKGSMKEWFTMFFTFFSALTALILIPYVVVSHFGVRDSVPVLPYLTIDLVTQTIFWTTAAAATTVFFALLSGLLGVIFRKNLTKESIIKPLSTLLVSSALLIPLSPYIAPQAVAMLTYRLAGVATRTAPDTAISLYQYSFGLHEKNYVPDRLMYVYEKEKDLDGAIATATKYMGVYADKDRKLYNSLLMHRASYYEREGKLQLALADCNTLIRQSPYMKNYAYAVRARIKAKNRDYQGAISDVNRSIAIHPSYYNYAYPVKVGILCQFGEYEQALRVVTRIEGNDCSHIKWSTIKGIIYEKLGRKTQAEFAYMKAYNFYKQLLNAKEGKIHDARSLTREEHLAGAYAAFKLGMKKESTLQLMKNSGYGYPIQKDELAGRLFKYSWDVNLPW